MKTLLVLLGPTAVGKTALSLHLAERFASPILSADSRQLYRDLPIGTAAPTAEELQRVRHYFIGTLGLEEYYSAAHYEHDVQLLLEKLFQERDVVVLTGGSMLYIDAVCRGIDDIPTVDADTRNLLATRLANEGTASLLQELRLLDPVYYARCDHRNHKRIVHALEVCYMTGRPFSSFHGGAPKQRPYRIVKLGLQRERTDLFDRINRRTDAMMAAGWLEEVRRVLPYRSCNALNTVGYKELFRHLDGEWPLDFALDRIRKNTRVYAKKQITWFKRDPDICWLHPDDRTEIDNFLSNFFPKATK